MKFDVNLTLMFEHLPLWDRPYAAAAAGFRAVEMWWPFVGPSPSDSEMSRMVRSIKDAGVQLIALNFDGGDLPAGDRGLVSLPRQEKRFRESVDAAVEIARQVGGCEVFNALYGNRLADTALELQREVATENLAYASAKARAVDAIVVLEALNRYENPHYPLTSTQGVLACMDATEESTGAKLWCLYDCYQMQRMEGNLTQTIRTHAARFGHVQIADPPGRNEPGTGEVNFVNVLAALDVSSYEGWVGLEYRPSSETVDPFSWLPENARVS